MNGDDPKTQCNKEEHSISLDCIPWKRWRFYVN